MQEHTPVVHIQVSVEVAFVPAFDGVIEDFKIADWIDCQESPRLAKKAILGNESMAAAILSRPLLEIENRNVVVPSLRRHVSRLGLATAALVRICPPQR